VLGCLVFMKGIEANPDEIRAILQMQFAQNRKEVQKLTGQIVALNRFIAKLVEHNLPFFMVLRVSTKMEWGPEQQKAFEDLKLYLQHLPTLSSLEQKQPLILCLCHTFSC
jgi:hypothetical protein